jgi:hypothetical protein
VILGPPLQIPLTTSRGFEIPPFPKKPLSPKFSKLPVFCLFDTLSFEVDSGQEETYFQNPREVFVHNRLKNKKLFHILYRCHQLGESKLFFSLIFRIFGFSCCSPNFAGDVSASWRKIGETEEGFCRENSHIQ